MMKRALDLARQAALRGEVPVGAVIIHAPSGEIIAESANQVEAQNNPLLHAEIVALMAALAARGEKYLADCDLYVTLEPCPMCAGALAASRIRRIYFGAYDPKSGGVAHGPKVFDATTCHHKPEVYGGVMESACEAVLKAFFQQKRQG